MTGLGARCPSCRRLLAADAARCDGCGRRLGSDLVLLEPLPPERAAPGGRARGRRLAVVVAAALVVGLLQWHSPDLVTAPPGDHADEELLAVSPEERVRRETLAELAGPPLPRLSGRSGARVLLLGPAGSWAVDADAGTAQPVVLPAGAGRPLALRTGAVVLSGGAAFALRPSSLSTARRLGEADAVFRSEADGRVWLRHGEEVREVTLDGRVTAGPVPVRAMGAGGGGLLVASSGGVEVRDVRTGSLLRRIDAIPPVIATGGDWVASADREGLRCDVVLSNVRTGAQRRVPLLPYSTCLQGRAAMSPDGRHLAVPAARYVRLQGQTDGALVLVDMEAGRADPIGRAGRRVPIFDALSWTPSGRWLFWLDPIGPQLVGAYRVGTDGAVAVGVRGLGEAEVDGLVAVGG